MAYLVEADKGEKKLHDYNSNCGDEEKPEKEFATTLTYEKCGPSQFGTVGGINNLSGICVEIRCGLQGA